VKKNNSEVTCDEDWRHTDKTLAMHSGYYEKGIRTHEDAEINKNKLIGRLLDLELLYKKGIIVDAGCGVGGTCIYFANKYPHIKFIGINISQTQIRLAHKFAQQHHVHSNTEFILGDYLATGLSDNFVDGIFTIEALTRFKDKKRFLQEANRILKKNKKLVIDEVFLIKKPSNHFMKLAYDAYCATWKIPYVESLKEFKTYLENLRFDDVKTMDITKNSWLSFFMVFLEYMSNAIFSRPDRRTKKLVCKITDKKSPISKNLSIFLMIRFSTSMFLLLNHNIRKIVITAIKK
jgi:ubiquinone/menaquinone biosynthesis C-methylase UbiE